MNNECMNFKSNAYMEFRDFLNNIRVVMERLAAGINNAENTEKKVSDTLGGTFTPTAKGWQR